MGRCVKSGVAHWQRTSHSHLDRKYEPRPAQPSIAHRLITYLKNTFQVDRSFEVTSTPKTVVEDKKAAPLFDKKEKKPVDYGIPPESEASWNLIIFAC